ncbi:hypothetical protein BVY04_00625 [bacterium M21]|nr:hypothetical protein BVY04_00625 [bacterium M21]
MQSLGAVAISLGVLLSDQLGHHITVVHELQERMRNLQKVVTVFIGVALCAVIVFQIHPTVLLNVKGFFNFAALASSLIDVSDNGVGRWLVISQVDESSRLPD